MCKRDPQDRPTNTTNHRSNSTSTIAVVQSYLQRNRQEVCDPHKTKKHICKRYPQENPTNTTNQLSNSTERCCSSAIVCDAAVRGIYHCLFHCEEFVTHKKKTTHHRSNSTERCCSSAIVSAAACSTARSSWLTASTTPCSCATFFVLVSRRVASIWIWSFRVYVCIHIYTYTHTRVNINVLDDEEFVTHGIHYLLFVRLRWDDTPNAIGCTCIQGGEDS